MSSTRTDNFNRSDEDPIATPSDAGSNWTIDYGDAKLVSNTARDGHVGIHGTVASLGTGTDSSVEATIVAFSIGAAGVTARLTGSGAFVTATYLAFFGNGGGNYALTEFTGGVPNNLFSGGTATDGDRIRLKVVGTTATAYVNGSVLTTQTTGVTGSGTWGIYLADSGGSTVELDDYFFSDPPSSDAGAGTAEFSFTASGASPPPDEGAGTAAFSFTATATSAADDSTAGTAHFSFAASGGGSYSATEIQSVVIAGASGGTFTLTFDNVPSGGNPQTTGPIAYNVNALGLKAALEALSNIATVNVTGLGTVASPFLVNFLDSDLNYDQMTADFSGLVAGWEWVFHHEDTNGITSLEVGTSGTDIHWTNVGSVWTLEVPDASVTARGAITTGTQPIGGLKEFKYGTIALGVNDDVLFSAGHPEAKWWADNLGFAAGGGSQYDITASLFYYNPIQFVDIAGGSGTFTLTFYNATTTALNWNDSTATVQAALEALSTIGSGNVAVSGSPGAYQLDFSGGIFADAALELITASGSASPSTRVLQDGETGQVAFGLSATLVGLSFPATSVSYAIEDHFVSHGGAGVTAWRFGVWGTTGDGNVVSGGIITSLNGNYTGDVYASTNTIDVSKTFHVIAVSHTTSATSTWTPSGGGTAGHILTLITEADGSGTVTVTFASTFHASGDQATTAGTFSSIVFRSDGTRWIEISRTTALA